ncbi:hypothetical protein J8273_0932 [Carpediemonas membranifera]|uniref:Uncharacterized protein n=1 Tax=Carpediemonas membranifera TaxID=201153 RepID=A0A8J6BH96_9EUKA|nr:hypothetical protein J8273_0932 [Carpediemonas membranifera]|eukprot:KAG9397437.1 hypothetical protein J8273_0932 [Carpediemonas membranifera]
MDTSRARLAAMRSSGPKSGSDVQRDAMSGLHSAMSRDYADLPGDIPTLMREAFTREIGEEFPDEDGDANQATAEEVTSALLALDLHHRSAITFINRVVAFLSHGPPLSMNVELAEGQELPAALHTLNQGAVWACLLGGGANPDLEDRVLEEYPEEWPDETKMHHKIRDALTPEGKCLWFLCRKFFFTLNVAEKDGECNQYYWRERFYHHRMYMGRLFMLCIDDYDTSFTRARMPRALEVCIEWSTYIARTPKGLWGWGENKHGQLGFESSYREFVDLTRLIFPACPAVAELEASLPPGRSTGW